MELSSADVATKQDEKEKDLQQAIKDLYLIEQEVLLISRHIINLQGKKKDLEIGVCGEHGGEPRSIEFFHQIGLDYVSCSPFRIFIAKLVAAQANIKSKALSTAAAK